MIKVGTSGFSFPDWRGIVYPENIRPRDVLPYYEKVMGFDCVEINFTYYTLPGVNTMKSLAEKTSGDFEFVVKAHRSMTHDPFDSRRAEKPDEEKIKESFQKFYSSLLPLRDTGKLGAVLFQFPVFFYPGPKSMEYMLQAKEWLAGIPMVIEFRDKVWHNPETYTFLKENDLSYCVVDEPPVGRLMPFVNEVTSSLSYLRFHGRNPRWFNVPASERYDYLYSEQELARFVPEIQKMEKRARKSYVFFNNCHRGSAPRNALKMKELLGLIEKVSRESQDFLERLKGEETQGELFE